MSPVEIEVRVGGVEPALTTRELEVREQLHDAVQRGTELVMEQVAVGGEPADSRAAQLRDCSETAGLAIIHLAVLGATRHQRTV